MTLTLNRTRSLAGLVGAALLLALPAVAAAQRTRPGGGLGGSAQAASKSPGVILEGSDAATGAVEQQRCAAAAADMSETGRRSNAECLIALKWAAFGIRKLGQPRPRGPGAPAAHPSPVGWYGEFDNGRIYVDAEGRQAFAVAGDIYKRFLASGGHDYFGRPVADEESYSVASAPDGRLSRFAKGAIYWWADTGAVPVVGKKLQGEILRFWALRGGPDGDFKEPVSDEEQRLSNGNGLEGRWMQFKEGRIGWFPDLGAFEITKVRVIPTALHVFGETDHDGGSDSDEYIVAFAALGDPRGSGQTLRPIDQVNGLDKGDTGRLNQLPIFDGAPDGLQLVTLLAEHDYGDPNRYNALIAGLMAAKTKALTLALGATTGPEVAGVIAEVAKPIDVELTQQLNALLDTGDEIFPPSPLFLAPADLVRYSQMPKKRFDGIEYDFETELISGFGGRLKVYFRVDRGVPLPAR